MSKTSPTHAKDLAYTHETTTVVCDEAAAALNKVTMDTRS